MTVVVVSPEGWPEGPEVHGVQAWRDQAERLRSAWEEARAEVEEVTEVHPDRVFARIRYVTKGGAGGLAFDTSFGVAFWLEDGLIKRAHYFWEPEEARAALEEAE